MSLGEWFTARRGLIQGVVLTLVITLVARSLVGLPLLSIMGTMVLAILIGIAWRALFGLPDGAQAGTGFSARTLLRLGIILAGVRLNINDIVAAGPQVLILATAVIAFAIVLINWLSRRFGVEERLGMLTAVGTGICGAAAIAGVAPVLKAKQDETAVSVATIAVLGTIFTILYSVLAPVMGLSNYAYGVFSGGTLHEIAHVVAASAAQGDEATRTALLVKLTRVALLVPVALLIGSWYARKVAAPGHAATPGAGVSASAGGGISATPGAGHSIQIPWFIFGFLGMAVLNTFGLFNAAATQAIVAASVTTLTMAMAGLGLNVDVATFRRTGVKTMAVGLIGSVLLSAFGLGLQLAMGIR